MRRSKRRREGRRRDKIVEKRIEELLSSRIRFEGKSDVRGQEAFC